MLWSPAVRLPVMKVACPAPFNATAGWAALSIVKTTLPAGVPDPGATAATVAVNVTDSPNAVGFRDELTVVVVAAWFTTWESVVAVLPAKWLSPPYTAAIVWVPTASDAVDKTACPDALSATGACGVPSMLNVTLPVGVPPLPDTVAVKVAAWPKTEGLTERSEEH